MMITYTLVKTIIQTSLALNEKVDTLLNHESTITTVTSNLTFNLQRDM